MCPHIFSSFSVFYKPVAVYFTEHKFCTMYAHITTFTHTKQSFLHQVFRKIASRIKLFTTSSAKHCDSAKEDAVLGFPQTKIMDSFCHRLSCTIDSLQNAPQEMLIPANFYYWSFYEQILLNISNALVFLREIEQKWRNV